MHSTLTQIQHSGSLRWSRAELRRPWVMGKGSPQTPAGASPTILHPGARSNVGKGNWWLFLLGTGE